MTAWCFDRAVATFGLAVENDVENAVREAKDTKHAMAAAQRTLARWLNENGSTKGMFRDPVMRG